MKEKTPIVGWQFFGDGELAYKAMKELAEGSPVIPVREPDNPADPNAVLLMDLFGRKMGYARRAVAAVVAKWMDGGYLVLGHCSRAGEIEQRHGRAFFRYPWATLIRDRPVTKEMTRPVKADPPKVKVPEEAK